VSPPPPSSLRPVEHSPETPAEFDSFYQVTLSPLRRYLATILGNRHEAQDIAHDAYMKTYRAMAVHPVEKPKSYLFTIARHLAISFKQRRGDRMQPTEAAALESRIPPAPDTADLVVARQESSALQAAILQLPPGCREVLILRNFGEHSHEEIARKLNISRSGVEKHLARALRLLREQMKNTR
jgi:RNA polymerase sigma factor (sigma-70 family)